MLLSPSISIVSYSYRASMLFFLNAVSCVCSFEKRAVFSWGCRYRTLGVFGAGPPAPPGDRFWQTLTFSVTLTWLSKVPTSVRLPPNRCSQRHQDYRYLARLKRRTSLIDSSVYTWRLELRSRSHSCSNYLSHFNS